MILLEFTLDGPPVSQQARRRERVREWRDAVHAAAAARSATAGSPVLGPLLVRIIYFYEDLPIDVDNMAKPILDGLKGVAFVDDAQVIDIVLSKRPLSWRSVKEPSDVFLEAWDRGRQFVHIIVEHTEEGEPFP